jgi:hypothetical protein
MSLLNPVCTGAINQCSKCAIALHIPGAYGSSTCDATGAALALLSLKAVEIARYLGAFVDILLN